LSTIDVCTVLADCDEKHHLLQMLGADAENRRMWKCSDWQKSNMMMMRLWCMKEQIATVEQNASLTVACGMYMYIQYKSLSSQCEW